ncbi:MAG TPA: LCP family protein [Pedococcus sp.]|nr:LCP family protein [Pedococcus sp.]
MTRVPIGLLLVLALAALIIPSAAVHSAVFSLSRVETAKHVDFEDGVVWILALGSDARPGEGLREARTDAIQLVGINFDTGSAVGIGIPRDSWVEIPGEGPDRINTALAQTDENGVARVVRDLVGILPDYVFVTGFSGLRSMVDSIDGVVVRSPIPFGDPEFGLTVRRGPNRFDGSQALDFTRSRKELRGQDFDRSANQQRLMLGILRQLQAHEDEDGFMERGTLAALAGLETDLPPTELYRLAQAVTQVETRRVTVCVIGGTPGEVEGQSVVFADERQARRLGADAKRDARLQRGCSG